MLQNSPTSLEGPGIDVIEAIHTRRSQRRFRPNPVSVPFLNTVLEAAVQAPSFRNEQPWAFAVFQGRTRLAALERRLHKFLLNDYPATSELPPKTELMDSARADLFHGADALIVIYASHSRIQPTEDCCLAAQNLMLAAHGIGLGTCPVGFARGWFDLPEVKRSLGISPVFTAVFPLVLGHPDGRPERTFHLAPRIAVWAVDAD